MPVEAKITFYGHIISFSVRKAQVAVSIGCVNTDRSAQRVRSDYTLVVDEVSSAGELSPADDLSGPIFTSCSGRPKQSVEAGLYKLPRAAGLRQRIECAISAIFHYFAI